jgi:hypothetical protein
MTASILSFVQQLLAARLDPKAADFVRTTQQEIQANIVDKRFTVLISLASRYIPRSTLSPSDAELALAEQLLPGWNPASWSMLEAVRVSFILANKDVAAADFAGRFSQWFTYADEGEQCAYYRAIPLLPEPQRFVWRAAEGCRTNMRSIFMSVACDSPFPVKHFDEVAWNQLVVKALFTETPLWRVYGLDSRLSDTLAVMVLDYMDERRSAGRSIPIDAWLCLGKYQDSRVDAAIAAALAGDSQQACAAILTLARAQNTQALQQLKDQTQDSQRLALIQQALLGPIDQYAFQQLLQIYAA